MSQFETLKSYSEHRSSSDSKSYSERYNVYTCQPARRLDTIVRKGMQQMPNEYLRNNAVPTGKRETGGGPIGVASFQPILKIHEDHSVSAFTTSPAIALDVGERLGDLEPWSLGASCFCEVMAHHPPSHLSVKFCGKCRSSCTSLQLCSMCIAS
jgi:hypothetical protein